MRLRISLVLFFLTCVPLFGGGAWISFADPQAAGEPSATGAVTVIRVIRGDGKTLDTVEVAGTAEGLVDGRRVSLAIVTEKLSTPGVRAIRWERPTAGQWVLTFNIYNDPNELGLAAVVRVGPNGVKPQTVLLSLGSGWTDALIDNAFSGTQPYAVALLPRGAWRNPE
jgi:hypothetical protein